MEKVLHVIKSNTRFILGIALGTLISAFAVYASNEMLSSNQIEYSNSNSSLVSTNLQNAINELDEKANSDDFSLNKYLELSEMPTNYIYGSEPPTTESPITPPAGLSVYIGLYEDGQYGVCVKINGKQECFRYGNWIFEAMHLKKAFGSQKCTSTSLNISCNNANFSCAVHSNGKIACLHNDTFNMCGFNDTNIPYCL